MDKLDTVAELYQGDVGPRDWVVWALDPSGDGGMFIAVFAGPDAEQRATEYAREKFRGFRLDEANPQRQLSDRHSVARVAL